jgi:hypothetical protein
MVFFLEITNIWQKFLKFLVILNFYQCWFIKDYLEKHFLNHRMVLFAKEIHRLGPMDLKIYSLERNP